MFDQKFLELMNNVMICEKLPIMSSPEEIADKINKFLIKQDVIEIDEESLVDKIKGLSENALSVLLEALKNKEVYRILSVLEIKFSEEKGISGE